MSTGEHSRIHVILAFALLLVVLAGCSPEPGTPEYVLAKLERGLAVGGENLDLLGPAHAGALYKLLADPKAERIARLQALDRLCQIDGESNPSGIASYIGDEDPEVRMRVIQWLSERPAEDSAILLLQAFESETEDLVRASLMRALQSVGTRTGDPSQVVIDRLAAGVAGAEGTRRVDWIRALGGWNGERVERLLTGLLDDRDQMAAVAAARSLQGPAARPIDRMAPIYVGLLAHERPEIRRAGLTALKAAAHPMGLGGGTGECAEKPALRLLDVAPDTHQAMESLLERADLSTADRKLAEALRDCLSGFLSVGTGEAG